MPSELAFPLTALAFATMDPDELGERHRELLARLRDIDHWRRLIAARLDLAVAAVADLHEPAEDNPGAGWIVPPIGLRDLLGIPRRTDRLAETALLPMLRLAQAELDAYAAAVQAMSDEASHFLAARLSVGWPDGLAAGDRAGQSA